MISAYMEGVDAAVDNTPATRNRVVDGWRALALLFVISGHWISASIWVQPDGTILAGNTLEWFPGAEHLTWIFQVMPIFFLAGGFANAAALNHDTSGAKAWTTLRARRLFTPTVPLVLVWVLLVLTLRPFVPDNVLHAGTLSATIPLWFIAVYLTMVFLAPITFRLWRKVGWISIVFPAACAVAVDVVRFGLDINSVGWINYLFVWGFVHQLGYAWFDRDRTGEPVPRAIGFASIGIGLGLLAATTSAGWYPVSMVTIPGGGISNMTPPTFANGFLTLVHLGLIVVTMSAAKRLVARRGAWRAVVAISASMMTLYLWHLTALSLLGAAGIFIGDGWLFSFEPGTTEWWLLRIPFFAVLALITVGLAAIFLRFEVRVNRGPPQRLAVAWVLGLVLSIVAPAAMALEGLVTTDADINWWIPVVAIGASALVGAYPTRPSSSRTG